MYYIWLEKLSAILSRPKVLIEQKIRVKVLIKLIKYLLSLAYSLQDYQLIALKTANRVKILVSQFADVCLDINLFQFGVKDKSRNKHFQFCYLSNHVIIEYNNENMIFHGLLVIKKNPY